MTSLEEYQMKVAGKGCRRCSTDLTNIDVEHYDHPRGWEVDGFDVPQWLYVTCDNEYCGYQNSLWKLGVS